MRKLKLLLAACALFGVTATTWAQDAGTYYIQNVSNGKWMAPGNSWETQASMLSHADYWKLAINDGVYTLESVVENKGAHYLSGTYCDAGATNFTITSVDGKEKTYTIATEDGKLVTANGSIIDLSGTDATAEVSQWKFWSEADMAAGMAAATVENPFDATYLIKDHNIGRNNRDYSSAWSNTGATEPKTSNSNAGGAQRWSIEAYCKTFDVNQTLTDVPSGVYAVRVNGFYRQDGSDTNLPYVYANDSKTTLPSRGTGTENDMQAAAVSFDAGNYLSDAAYVQVTDGTLKIGVATEGTSCWSIFKNFHLYYYGDCTVAEVLLADYVKAYNTALAEAQAFTEASMFAEAWTNLQTAISDNTLNLSSVTQEQLETATANLKAANAAATAAVKAKTAYDNAVTLINGGTNVDLTSIITNAGFEEGNLNGWTSVDGGAIANNTNFNSTKFVERWKNGVALGAGSLTHDAIFLPAGVYRITADAQNIEQYNNNAGGKGLFLCANNEQTEIGAKGNYETSVKLADKESLTIKFLLNECTGNWIAYDNVTLTYVSADYEYTLVDGNMNAEVAAAQTTAKETFVANQTGANYNALMIAIAAAQASKDAYAKAATAIANAKDLQNNHNLASETAATTFAEAIAAIENPYNDGTLKDADANDAVRVLGTGVTNWHAGANGAAVAYMNDGFSLHDFDAALYVNTWSTEGENDGSNFKVPFYEYFAGEGGTLGANTWTATLNGLENGLYSVSAWVRVRSKNADTDAAEATGITMNVNDGTAIDVTEGDVVPVEEGNARFQHKVYTAEGLVKDGVLKVNFNIASENNIHWLSFKNIKYTKVRDLLPEEEIVKATAEDLANLNDAIESTEAKTLGFEKDEYAPYNNVEALKALAAAKAIDQTAENLEQTAVQEATAALTNATWTANTEEVNAIYDGDFAIQELPSDNTNIRPLGWARNSVTANVNNGSDGGYETRLVAVPEGATSTNKGMMTKFHSFYGDQIGYQLPLKANTSYVLSFRYGGWGNTPTMHINVYSEDGTKITASTDFTAKSGDGNTGAANWTDYSYVFKTTDAGNYVLGFIKNSGGTEQRQMGFGDISLVKAATATMSITEDAQYATFCAPFDVTIPEGVSAYTVTSLNQATLALTDVETTIPANTPVVLFSESTVNEEFAGAAIEGTPSNGLLTGVYAETDAPVGSYVMQKQGVVTGFYKVAEGKQPTVPANRAYLTAPSEARALYFNNATAIRAIEALTSGEAEIYNAAGARQNSLQKGVNIIKQGNKTYKVMVK